jgi:hypothetical protein
MHTVNLLDAAIRHARELGIHVREDWLDGASGGECEISGEPWLFLDLTQSPQERLDVVTQCLAAHALVARSQLPPELQSKVHSKPAA